MAISSIGTKFGEYAAKGIGSFARNKHVRNICEKFKDDPIKYAGYATLASLATKDAVGCYLYVTQSLNNKKIPEDKRRFVANMDLTNGILNVVTQIALTFGLKKFYRPMFDKMLYKSFNKKACKELITAYRKDAKASGDAVLRKLEAEKKLKETKDTIYSAFEATMNIVVATIIAKRCVVPFLSTPLTQYFTNRHDKKVEAQKAKEQKSDVNVEKEKQQKQPEQPEQPEQTKFNGETNLLTKYKNTQK